MTHLIPAITDFQTKRDTFQNIIQRIRAGTYTLYTTHSAYIHSQIQLTPCFSSDTEVNSLNHAKKRAVSFYT